MEKHAVRVEFANGNHIITTINGSKEQVREYYAIGRTFNVGNGPRDEMSKVASVKFLDEKEKGN